MRILFLFFTFSLQAIGGNENDPQYCAYWLYRLGMIAGYETCRVEDVPRVAVEENRYAAVDLDIELRERIREIMRGISKCE